MKKGSIELKKIISAIKQAAKELDKKPYEITKTDLLSNEYGVTEWDIRKLGGLDAVKKAHFPFEEKLLKDVRELKQDKSYILKLENQIGARLLLEEEITNALTAFPKLNITPYKVKSKVKIKRALNLVLSDLHIGSDIKKEETGKLDFGKVEESRRLAKIIQETIEYKIAHRDETELNVLLIGDIFENRLHDMADGAPLSEQFSRALYLLTQAIGQLSSHFPKVTVYCLSGNHCRDVARHPQRAVNQKWDSIGTMLHYSLKTALASNKNITFVLPKTPYHVYEVFGKKIFISHGDTVLKVGYPGTAIKTGSLEDQINSINASLPDNEEYSVFVVGHVHVGSCTHLSNGAVLITNGPLVPPNDFAISIGIFETACGQYIFESVQDYPVGDIRYIKINSTVDADKSLDQLIKPFVGFNEKN